MRYALISTTWRENIRAYLPSNYKVLNHRPDSERSGVELWVIGGEDVAGWTLDGYVLPRLASGLISGYEIDLGHPILEEMGIA